MPPVDRDRAGALMMAALDGECTSAERQELDALLAAHPEIAAEWERLRRVREVMADMKLTRPPEEVWDRFRTSVLHRTERSIAWALITVGAAVTGAWIFWQWIEHFVAAVDVPWPVKVGVMALVAGGLILLISVVRERWVLHRRDPYSREVIR